MWFYGFVYLKYNNNIQKKFFFFGGGKNEGQIKIVDIIKYLKYNTDNAVVILKKL